MLIRRDTRTLRLISLGFLVHFSIFLGALHIYFSSPVEYGLTSFRADVSFTDRVIVFVADGLRYETLGKHGKVYAPFLDAIRHNGSWGVSFTQVPTESRPGHIALFGGMYEDPSALLSGWQLNPIDVDTVFNQSDESWLWGSPDIVPLFNRDNLRKINTFYYDPSFEDFSGSRSTIELDRWVFDNVKEYFKGMSVEYCAGYCKFLLGGRKIFFLHLLGMDTVGHVFKPNSRQYLGNLHYVDESVEEMYIFFEKFYKDRRSTYIFTSDHGMTNWGSHGSGSDHEIQSPFIVWGSGIDKQGEAGNISQADVAPLISALLGTNIPTNSVGLVPYQYLDATLEEEALLLLCNAKQLGERFNVKHERMERTTIYGFFKPFEQLNKTLYDQMIKNIEKQIRDKSYETAKNDTIRLIDLIRGGDRYINQYYKYPLLFSLSMGLILWIIYLAVNIIPEQEADEFELRVNRTIVKRCLINYGLVIIALVIALYHNGVQLKYWFYILFPCLLIIPLIYELNQLAYLIIVFVELPKLELLRNALFSGLGFYLLSYSFYCEYYIVLPMLLLLLWGFLTKTPVYDLNEKLYWAFMLFVVGFFNMLSKEVFKRFYGLAPIASFVLMSHMVLQAINAAMKLRRRFPKKPWQLFHCFTLHMQLGLFVMTTLTWAVYNLLGVGCEMIQYFICAISWAFLFICISCSTLSPRYLKDRSFSITICLYAVFVMTNINEEALFLILFIKLLLHWVHLEMKQSDCLYGKVTDTLFGQVVPFEKQADYGDLRRCFFFLCFILMSFFGMGNSADMNTFDPMWARQFVIVFNPVLSAFIILLKITIPFLIATVFFQSINRYSCTPTINVFSIIMLFCDILVFYFMYDIKNEGSWLYIGLSISRFVIVMVMTLILLLFYVIAKALTHSKLFEFIAPRYIYLLKA